MANYICQVTTPVVASEHIIKVTVPNGGLKAGQVVFASALDNTIANNYEVFTAVQPDTSVLNNDSLAIIVNDGFETLADGRRPDGQPNYYQYTFVKDETAPAIYLDKHLFFDISVDTITKASSELVPAAGQYLYPTNGSNSLTLGTSLPEGQTKYLKVLAVKYTPIGGNFGGGFAQTLVCQAR